MPFQRAPLDPGLQLLGSCREGAMGHPCYATCVLGTGGRKTRLSLVG